ncbi:hypothetical protein PMIN01_12684 [Paraphaeosphaeria minitans]|uniref:Yeast cell wall synthesis Kre9/Knh1-like N-terminal domain-containing protein n=1 Tax=Paraphaeosphaeria minitans TaxID=565426 RepID=A0A9P6KK18_9PLEO|nr:hypothetical protein PMIN01_12684 [Paraphaeosphaeria minitans]
MFNFLAADIPEQVESRAPVPTIEYDDSLEPEPSRRARRTWCESESAAHVQGTDRGGHYVPIFVQQDAYVMVFARLVQFVSSDEIYSFIHPEIDDVVYAGEPYEIRWDPGAPDRVDVWLWSGTSTSVFQDDFIAVGTENSGSYRWLPAKTLARTDVDHYNLNMFAAIFEFVIFREEIYESTGLTYIVINNNTNNYADVADGPQTFLNDNFPERALFRCQNCDSSGGYCHQHSAAYDGIWRMGLAPETKGAGFCTLGPRLSFKQSGQRMGKPTEEGEASMSYSSVSCTCR